MDEEIVQTARECLEQEIKFRESLLEKLDDPDDHEDLKWVWRRLRKKGDGDEDLFPGGDTWAQVRLEDGFRKSGEWDADDRYVVLD